MSYHFMANCTLPDSISMLPDQVFEHQQEWMEYHLSEGVLVNYALSLEHCRIWAIFNAESEMEVMELLINMPYSDLMQVEVSMLSVFAEVPQAPPSFSLN